MAARRVTPVDWLMLALAIISVAMLAYETWGDPTPEQTRQIFLADYVIIGIFALEFLFRWSRDDNKRTFVWRNWYVGLVLMDLLKQTVTTNKTPV